MNGRNVRTNGIEERSGMGEDLSVTSLSHSHREVALRPIEALDQVGGRRRELE